MLYKDYAKINETYFPTGIHTKIDKNMRISSVYRRYANGNFESWGWETILWKKERIEREFSSIYSADEVVNLHVAILNGIKKADYCE